MIKITDLIQDYDSKIFKLEEQNKKLAGTDTVESFKTIFNNDKKIEELKNEQKEVIKIKKKIGNEVDEYIYKSTLEPAIKNVNKLKR